MTYRKKARKWVWVRKSSARSLTMKEISLAVKHLESASRNLAANDLSTAANRLYLAVERATVALMIGLDGRLSRDHGYIQSAFDDFCDRDLFKSSRLRGWLADQYGFRLEGDYGTWRTGNSRLNRKILITKLAEGEKIIRTAKDILLRSKLLSP